MDAMFKDGRRSDDGGMVVMMGMMLGGCGADAHTLLADQRSGAWQHGESSLSEAAPHEGLYPRLLPLSLLCPVLRLLRRLIRRPLLLLVVKEGVERLRRRGPRGREASSSSSLQHEVSMLQVALQGPGG